MGKVIQTIERVLAYCDDCGKKFTPRINRRIPTCPGCRTAVLGAEDVPLRGEQRDTVIDEKIIEAAQ